MEKIEYTCHISGILYRPTLQALSCRWALPKQLRVARHINLVVQGIRADDLESPDHTYQNNTIIISPYR